MEKVEIDRRAKIKRELEYSMRVEMLKGDRQSLINKGICPDCGGNLYERRPGFLEKGFGGCSDWEDICPKCGVMSYGYNMGFGY